MDNSAKLLACPLCYNHFPHSVNGNGRSVEIFGYGLDFRLLPRDSQLAADVATCPHCLFTSRTQDFHDRVAGHVKDLVRSPKYVGIFKPRPGEDPAARSWPALLRILELKTLNPRDLGILALKGSWVARELGSMGTEAELLNLADKYMDEALRRGLTKGDPGMVIYLLGEINRRRQEFGRAREMLTFLGNNPRYRYAALLMTVLVEEEDATPYWSHYSPDLMEYYSPRFKGLFPALRSIPPSKTEFSPDELKEEARDDCRRVEEEDDRRSK